MNGITDLMKKIPKDKLYKPPKIKENKTKTEKESIIKLDSIIREKRNNTLKEK